MTARQHRATMQAHCAQANLHINHAVYDHGYRNTSTIIRVCFVSHDGDFDPPAYTCMDDPMHAYIRILAHCCIWSLLNCNPGFVWWQPAKKPCGKHSRPTRLRGIPMAPRCSKGRFVCHEAQLCIHLARVISRCKVATRDSTLCSLL